MKFLTLLLLFCITLEIREIPKYGSISFFGTQYIYLNLDGFKSGDNVSFHLNCTSPKYSIQYRESNSFLDILEIIHFYLCHHLIEFQIMIILSIQMILQ